MNKDSLNNSDTVQQEAAKKAERIILDLNRSGMEYLAQERFRQALELLKKAEKLVNDEVKINAKDPIVNKLVGITFNNLGCYYKKTNKPKVALGYLKRALEIEVYNVEDWISTAGTHLNICAIFSYMGRHTEAADHAGLSIKLLEREQKKPSEETSINKDPMLNILMISYYNLAVQLEYLREYAESRDAYKKSLQVSKNLQKAQNMAKLLEESIQRTSELVHQNERKAMLLIDKKREQEEKGYHQYMRRNKKNDPRQQQFQIKMKKYNEYSQPRLRATSTADQEPSKISRDRSEVKVSKKKQIGTIIHKKI